MLNEFSKGLGAIKDAFDARDFQWGQEVGFAAKPYDWSQPYDIETIVGKLPVKDQGTSFSCGGQAWASYMTVKEAYSSKSLEERSAKFIYSQVYVPGGGSAGRTINDLLKNKGAAREAVTTSYQNGQPPTEDFIERKSDITAQAYYDALSDLSISYANVNVDIDTVAQAIRDNQGVVLGIYGANNGTWLDSTPVPPTNGESKWAHWVYAGKIKMVNGRKFIGILNSWGTDTGELGWQWLSQEYFASFNIWQCWTLVSNSTPVQIPDHIFLEDIQFGDNDIEVQFAQQLLQKDGSFPAGVPTTTYFGQITLAAVKKYQIKYGITSPDTPGYGRIGPKTRASFNKLTTSSAGSLSMNWKDLIARLWKLLINR